MRDIIKGNEPDLTAEYVIVMISSIFFVSIIYLLIKKFELLTGRKPE